MLHGNEFFNTASALVLFMVLVVAVATDLKNHRIPNFLLLPALVFTVILHGMSGGMDGLITAVGGLTLGLAMLFPLYAMGGMGAGDVKLLGIVGSFIGPWGAVVAGLSTMMVGAVFGIAVIVWRRMHPVFELNTAHLLSTHASGAGMRPVAHSVNHQSSTTSIPYAPAIAAGTLIALWYIGFFPMQFPG